MRRGIGRLRAGGASSFSPSQISFTSGLWLAPDDSSTGFQDSGGTTRQTASGQPTGMRLDKRLGLTRGSEQLTNGSGNTASGWTYSGGAGGGVASVAGELVLTAANTISTLADRIVTTPMTGLTVGLAYELIGNARRVSGGTAARVSVTQNLSDADTSGTFNNQATGTTSTAIRLIFVATATTMYVRLSIDGATSNSQAAASSLSVRSVAGNHVLQSGATARPEYDVLSGIASDFCDGSNDGYSTATGITLVNGMDLFVALNRSSTGNMIPISEAVASATKFIGAMQAATSTSGSAAAGVGSAWTCYVNGVQVGGTATTTAAQLNTAMGSGAYKVLEFRDLDLSAWTQFTFGLYTSNMYGGDDAQLVLCPAQSSTTRDKLRTYVGAKAGLSL